MTHEENSGETPRVSGKSTKFTENAPDFVWFLAGLPHQASPVNQENSQPRHDAARTVACSLLRQTSHSPAERRLKAVQGARNSRLPTFGAMKDGNPRNS